MLHKRHWPWAIIAGFGIAAITGLEFYALSKGINGTTLTASIAALAALGGASVRQVVGK
jgi:hypothetical protein